MSASDKLISLAVSTAQTVLADVPHSCIQTAVNRNSILPSNISEFRMPFLTDDENVKKIIQEFHLERPDKFAHLIVESFFAQYEVLNENMHNLARTELNKMTSTIRTAKQLIDFGIDNPSLMEKKFQTAQDMLFNGTELLMGQIKDVYIQRIRDIDNRPKFSFFIKSKLSLKDVDEANHLAKEAMSSLIDAYNLQTFICSKLDYKIDSIHKNFDDFTYWLNSGDNCRLMHAYDDMPQNEFWLTVPKKINFVEEKKDALTDYFEEAEEEFSEEDINFD